jgi:peptidyl-prolyl cis-trans isomerase B (cyclophilin B)
MRTHSPGTGPGPTSAVASWACGLGPLAVVLALAVLPALASQTKGPADPVVVFETAKGTFEIQLFQADAPKSVEQILTLVKRSFYRGQRIHRVTPTLVQWGDPKSKDMTFQEYWGTGGSGRAINAFEVSKKHTHVRGAVGLAHSGNPMAADSQIYVMKAASASLDGKHAVIGQVTTGMAVVDKLQVTDVIKNVSLKGAGPK